MVDTEQLRADHPIANLIAGYGIELRRVGSALVGRCPFHPDRGRPNLHVYSRSNRWICYRCGESGDIIDFVRRIGDFTFLEAVSQITGGATACAPEIRGKARRHHPPAGSPIKCVLRTDDLNLLSAAADLYANRLLSESAALEYLAGRGFARDILERYRVGYASGDEVGKLASYPDGKEQLAAAIVRAAEGTQSDLETTTSSNGSSIVIQNKAAF